MKKYLFLILSFAMASSASYCAPLDVPDHVNFKKGCFGLRISPNGKWIANYTGYAKIYNVENDEMTEYSNCTLTMGNAISNDGIALAGSVLLKDGEIISPKSSQGGGFYFEGITPDSKYVCGSWRGGPFVGELDENLNIINPVSLPRPQRDLFDSRPQWINAVWISADGKTVAGQVQDGYGMYLYPIIFYVDNNGDWQYNIPIDEVFNPNEVLIYHNPVDAEPPKPHVEDYMDAPQRLLYEEALKGYNSGNGINPDPKDFMTEEKYQQYVADVETYNEWYYASREEFNRYLESYYEVVQSSPSFKQSELSISPSGEYIYMNGGILDALGNMDAKLYEFTRTGKINRVIDLVNPNQAPTQVLSDGTIMTSPPLMAGMDCYMLLPDSEEFISISDYLYPEHPEIALWIEESFPGGSGVVSMSDDKSVMVGTIFVTQLSDDLYENSDFRYASYIINFNETGVESIMDDFNSEVYKVYNLQGLKVLETKDASEITGLPQGIYIINGKKVKL